jgi:exodeoxyribonuclease V alpha subunit
MIRRNDYRSGLYKGDVGVALYNESGQIRVWFMGDHGLRAFLPSALTRARLRVRDDYSQESGVGV